MHVLFSNKIIIKFDNKMNTKLMIKFVDYFMGLIIKLFNSIE